MKVRGVVKGKTIELDEVTNLSDGARVEVYVRMVDKSPLERTGFKPMLRKRGARVSNELVNEIREELGI